MMVMFCVGSSGAVVTLECVEKLIKTDMMDPVSGDKLADKDIIPLQRVRGGSGLQDQDFWCWFCCSCSFLAHQGGTGFAGCGVQLKAKEARPVMQV